MNNSGGRLLKGKRNEYVTIEEQKYSIKELEKISGIKAHTLRIWERRYGVLTPKRTDTNRRYYNDEDVVRLLNVSLLNRKGVKISHIMEMDDASIRRKVLDEVTSGDEDAIVDELVMATMRLDEAIFEKSVARAVLKMGFEKAVITVLFPFLERLGLLWQVGSISPAKEHFVANLIRQKMIVAIDAQPLPETNAPVYLLYLHQEEWHELGLLFRSYLIRQKGYKVIYLGQSVPFQDLEDVVKSTGATAICTHFVAEMDLDDMRNYLNMLSSKFPDIQHLVSGHQLTALKAELPQNIKFSESLEDFLQLL